MDELLATCDKVKAAGKTCIALGNQTPWITQLIPYAIAPSTAFKEDPNLAQDMLDGKKTFSNSGWRTVFERYLELDKKGDFNKSPNGTTFEQQQAMVGNGKAAMAIQVTSVATGILDAAKDKADIATFPFPGGRQRGRPEDPGGRRPPGSARARRASTSTEAKKFIDWLAQPAQMADVRDGQPVDPARRRRQRAAVDIAKPFASFLIEGKTVPFMDQQWPNAKVQPAHFAGVQDLFAGKTDIDGLLASSTRPTSRR